MVECKLPKLEVAGSIPVARSSFFPTDSAPAAGAPGFMLFRKRAKTLTPAPAGAPQASPLSKLPGPHMTPGLMLELAEEVKKMLATDEIYGVVITHGTDTLEETAYCLDLLIDSPKPVAVVGAMRNSSELGWELGWKSNLVDDFRLGYLTGKRPDIIVTDKNRYQEWIPNLKMQDPKAYTYTTNLLENEFHPVHRNEGYITYFRTSRANPSSHGSYPSCATTSCRCGHPARWWRGKWGGQGIYPVEENKFVSNMAAELPFDTVCGPTYDAIDILMPPQERKANQPNKPR